MCFNEYKKRATNDGNISMSPLMALFGGMSAGCFSTLGNNPFDVVKTRMQGTQASQYKNTLDCFKQILRNEGVGAFYVGVAPRLGRVVPDKALSSCHSKPFNRLWRVISISLNLKSSSKHLHIY